MKNEKIARIKYHEDYNGFGEGFAVEIISEEEWELDTFFPLVTGNGETGEKNYVRFNILNKIKELLSLGYKIV